MKHWQTIKDLDDEIIFNLITQYYLDESCSDISLSTRDREMIPAAAMQDMAQDGDPLFDIQINQQKLRQLLGRVRAQQQIAATTGELIETHSDREERLFEFGVTDELALYHLMMNANAMRQLADLPDIAPPEILNSLSAYPHQVREPMRQMVQVSLDLDVLQQAIEFAKRTEQEADQGNPFCGEEP